MAMIHGKGGSVTWGGTGTVGGEITSWSVEASCDTADVTNMSSSDDWKEFLAGFKTWTASVEVLFDSSDTTFLTALGADAATLSLEIVDGGANLEGSAICTGVGTGADTGDAVKISFSFQGTGALAYGAS